MTETMHPRGNTPIADDIAAETIARFDAALRAGWAILGAYQRGLLNIDARYLADTLGMVLDAVSAMDPNPPRQLMP